MSSNDSVKLRGIIEKAMHDLEITTSEYERIFAMASSDQHVDGLEQSLLSQLQEMVSNGMIKRVPG